MSVLNNSNAIETGGYNIQRSLRFRSSAGAYLSKTFAAATSTTTCTWSGWVKRGTLGVRQCIWSSSNYEFLRFMASDAIEIAYLNNAGYVSTSAVFRDPSAWYHIVLVFDTTNATAANRMRLYVNGVQQTLNWGATPQTLNATFQRWNVNTYTGDIGDFQYNHTDIFDGYMAEVNWIDGQALTPSSFGQTDPVTGVWTPKKYTGTYGTNGFYLPFSDNTSATTLAYDKSGNGNNWTANNISTTSGASYDSMTDVPTLTSATAANFATLNPIGVPFANGTVVDGNLKFTALTTTDKGVAATISMDSGKFYWESTKISGTASENYCGVILTGASSDVNANRVYIRNDGNIYKYGTALGVVGPTFVNNDVIGLAYDYTAATLAIYKNGTLSYTVTGLNAASHTPWVGGYTTTETWVVNFGQRPFSYTPPTGFKALNTFNLPDPTIKKPNQYMDATTYTGTGATQSIVNAGAFQPDLIWLKSRSGTFWHYLVDSVRGVGKQLYSNATYAEGSYTNDVTSFNSNGFTLGNNGDINTSGGSLVGWQWKKGATPGFDIVTYTGDGTATRNISHSLGVAPKMIIVKSRTVSGSVWLVGHNSVGWDKGLYLQATNAANTSSVYFNNTAPTSSVFTLGNWGTDTNGNGSTYVAYLFAEIAGFSKFGSYTGNGSTDGPFVYCGFRPKYVMVKCTTAAATWTIIDSSRDLYNVSLDKLAPNSSVAENDTATFGSPTTVNQIDILSNGFKQRGTDGNQNANGQTYIYAAFAENPLKYSLAR